MPRQEADERALLGLAFDRCPLGMLVLGLDPTAPGTLLRVNRAFERMTGYRRERLPAAGWAALVHPEDRTVAAELDGWLHAPGRSGLDLHLRLLAATGEPLEVRVTAVPGPRPAPVTELSSDTRQPEPLPAVAIVYLEDLSPRPVGPAPGRLSEPEPGRIEPVPGRLPESPRLTGHPDGGPRRELERADRERLAVEADLREALHRGWLVLHYQPVIRVASGALVAAEALLRIDHPERGLLLPADFIDVAEASDLIVQIGEWVLVEACRQLSGWQRIGALELAVNVSGRQVIRPELAGTVLAAARGSGADPTGLCLELTERVLVQAGPAVVERLRELAAHGVRIAIDDFGTGHSSLTYLQRLPVDTVKIDRSFVAGLGVQQKDTAIVSAVTALGAALDLMVVAEGVETPAQLAELRGLGCPRAQGFHLGRPGPAGELTERLLASRP